MNGENKRREFRSCHPKSGRGRLGNGAKQIQASRLASLSRSKEYYAKLAEL
jgi:hypothetical protein